ncbi:MAG: pentapeptide repeat-containing protein [Candidatus Riflebacteria bacterium]|nr:pentapeptide repeat-containing protein [Candidatus Riflebacteria bacterium]
MEFWRSRWKKLGKEKVVSILNILGEEIEKEEKKKRIFDVSGFPILPSGEVDLRGFDITILDNLKRNPIPIPNRNYNNELDLTFISFEGARLTDLDLSHCCLHRVKFQKATLRNVNFSNSDLSKANLIDADLRDSIVRGAKLGYTEVSWDTWDFQGTILREINFGESLFFDPLIENYSKDQNYYYVMKHRASFLDKWLWRAWKWSCNYGQDLFLWFCWTIFIISIFGGFFSFSSDWENFQKMNQTLKCAPTNFYPDWWPKLHFNSADHGGFSYYYFSVVVFTTLGFGDIYPMSTGSQFLVVVEVLMGFMMLGVLMNILGKKIFRA